MITPVSGNNRPDPMAAAILNPPKNAGALTLKAEASKTSASAPAADTATISQQAQLAAKNYALEHSKAHEATESPVTAAREAKQQGVSQVQALTAGAK